jgi:hypothetical protein
MPTLPFKNILKKKPKGLDFLVLELGLEKVTVASFKKEETLHLVGVGHKKYDAPDEIFDATLGALDSLAAIVNDLPRRGIIGVAGGSLETSTTIVRYNRDKPNASISTDETEHILRQVVENLDTKGKRIFFSTIAGSVIDGVKVTNPLGLKGNRAELSCFVAFRNEDEIELLDRLSSEIDMKIERIMPVGFALAKLLERKDLRDVLIFRAGMNKSELTSVHAGHISEIIPVDLGIGEPDYFHFILELAAVKLKKENFPPSIWVYADHEEVDLEKVNLNISKFPWHEKLGVEENPKVQLATEVDNFSPSDMGLYSLAKEFVA